MTLHKFTITAARGMLPLLQQELNDLGIKQIKQEQGSLRFTGTMMQAYEVCLWSRVAIRVLMPIGRFAAETSDALYEGIKQIAWEDHIDAEQGTIAVDFTHFRSKLRHSQYGAQRVKDGIVDRLRDLTGQRPSVEFQQPDVHINVYVKHNQATVSIDLSGESLHKRGYRVASTEAPLKEHLAAAILLQSEWPNLAKQGWALLDPMSGSGTFLIEAAMIAADIAPGLQRDYFGFLYWKQHDKSAWKTVKAEALRRRQAGLVRLPEIVGGDADAKAVKAAQVNIAEAGLAEKISVKHCELSDWLIGNVLPEQGLLVSNPPYGQRLGDKDNLSGIYRQIGELIKQVLPAWRTTLITDNAELGKDTGLNEFARYPMDNGPIACQVMQYRAVRKLKTSSESQPVVEAAFDTAESEVVLSSSGQMFVNRLRKNLKHLAKWARKNDITCYRVYDADLPDYAVAIDLYGDYVHVQEYAPPKHIDPEKAVERLTEVMQSLPATLSVPQSHIVLKLRQKQRGSQQYQTHAALKQRFEVTESGGRFWVNLMDYLDTGLFLDHRQTRQRLASLATGQDFLNLFAYTGSATVYAAMGGAKSTTTVDMSNTYLSWAKDNMALNGFTDLQHQFVRDNCVSWLSEAKQNQQRYGLIFLDPPTFSNSSRMEGVFDIQRDHVDLIKSAMDLLTEQGHLVFSTNRRDFKFDDALMGDYQVKDISHETLPPDFSRNSKIHSCWLIQHQ